MKKLFTTPLLTALIFATPLTQAYAEDDSRRCSVAPAGYIIGKRLTPEIQEEARLASRANKVVVNYAPLDHRTDRLQINTNNDGIVTDVNCG